jgi:serine/threonine-protein kinase
MRKRVIGQYRITSVLGQGGMGVVYAAEHALLGRPAAVKVLRPELSGTSDAVTRFFNEARSATVIGHPGIVEIYDFGWTPGGTAFIVMELLRGETLRARRGRTQLPWSTALALTRQIAGALGAAHAKGIVHRDLKPDNIFLVLDPEVPGGERIKLLDFGLAKLVDPPPGQHLTRTGALLGTPTYMAPEQCRGVAVDARADLYALGCILFELCTGQPPFIGEGHGDVLMAHINTPPPTIASLAWSVPPEIEVLVQRLLAKAPGDRAQTAEEVVRLVDTTVAAIGVIAPGMGAAGGISAGGLSAGRISSGSIFSDTIASSVTGREPVRVPFERADSTLSSAASTHLNVLSPAPRRRVALVGGGAGVVALAAAIALAAAGRGDASTAAATGPSAEPVLHAAEEPAPPPAPSPPAITVRSSEAIEPSVKRVPLPAPTTKPAPEPSWKPPPRPVAPPKLTPVPPKPALPKPAPPKPVPPKSVRSKPHDRVIDPFE